MADIKYKRVVLKLSGEALPVKQAMASIHPKSVKLPKKSRKFMISESKSQSLSAAAICGAAKQAQRWAWNVRKPTTSACLAR